MSTRKENSPLVLIVAEGFGLSIRESGNAVMAANPTNFYRMWANEPHTLLMPKISKQNLLSDRYGDLTRLSTGRSFAPEKDYYKEMVAAGVFNNIHAKQFLADVQIHNSALHLFASVSSSYENGDSLDVVVKLAEDAKSQDLYRVFVHLFLDASESTTKLHARLKTFAQQIEQKTSAEIVTISGTRAVYSNPGQALDSEAVSAILNGSGKRAISVDQAIGMIPTNSDNCPVISIIHRRGFSGKVGEFDSVLFCDYDLSGLSSIVGQFSGSKKRVSQIKIPRFVTLATLYESPDVDAPEAKVLVPGYYSGTLPQILSEDDVSFKIIADTSSIQAVKQYFVSNSSVSGEEKNFRVPFFNQRDGLNEYKAVLSDILKYLRGETLPRFVYIQISLISQAIAGGEFSDVVNAVKIIDQFLPIVTKAVWAHGGTVLFTANHSGAEQMLNRNGNELRNGKTYNPVPFVMATGKHSYSTGAGDEVISDSFFDMIKKAGKDVDICPTVLDSLGVSIPVGLEGRSLMQGMNKN